MTTTSNSASDSNSTTPFALAQKMVGGDPEHPDRLRFACWLACQLGGSDIDAVIRQSNSFSKTLKPFLLKVCTPDLSTTPTLATFATIYYAATIGHEPQPLYKTLRSQALKEWLKLTEPFNPDNDKDVQRWTLVGDIDRPIQ